MDRIELDKLGLDEIVVEHPTLVHIERMDDGCMWIGIYKGEGPDSPWVSIFLNADGPITAHDGDGTWDEVFGKSENER